MRRFRSSAVSTIISMKWRQLSRISFIRNIEINFLTPKLDVLPTFNNLMIVELWVAQRVRTPIFYIYLTASGVSGSGPFCDQHLNERLFMVHHSLPFFKNIWL